MSAYAIQVEGVSKRYRIGKAVKKERVSLLRAAASPFAYLVSSLKEPPEDETIWALRDISMDVGYGEVLGVIGKNGAGKSTLLKILSRVTEPTRGRALLYGNLGSLLEVGTGFHPELTGRENIFLNGAIMGMKRAEVERKFEQIVEFAEIGKFLDTPVKRYSSGMYVRLAFAVAANLEPDILFIDEVLAVGDAAFQKKCLGKMGDVARAGRTILFVSHNMVALQNLCTRAVLISEGRLVDEGEPRAIIAQYLNNAPEQTAQVWDDMQTAPGNDQVRIHSAAAVPQSRDAQSRDAQSRGAQSGGPRPADPNDDAITTDKPIEVEIKYWKLDPTVRLFITLHIYNEQQVVAFSTSSIETGSADQEPVDRTGLYRAVCNIPAHLLNSGMHRVMLLVVRNGEKIIYQDESILSFDVLDLETRKSTWYGKEPGVIHPRLPWQTEFLDILPY